MEYQRLYCHKTLIRDCSFIVLNNDLPVAICPLFLEKQSNNHFFSASLGYQMAPLTSSCLTKKQRKKAEHFCFEYIDELAQKNNVVKCLLQLDSLVGEYLYNILIKYGYLDASMLTGVVDLRHELETLWSDLRKSFKSLINNGRDNLSIFIMDFNNPDYEIHEWYRKLHHKTAGRITRPRETFDLQFEDLKNDKAMVIALKDKERFVAFSYYAHFKDSAYYVSASDDPGYDSKIPLEHCIMWSAMEYYKKRGISFLETGEQQFSPQVFDHPTPKDITISFFKRGFGGKIIPLYCGIKYYDREFMKQDLETNTDKLSNDYCVD